MSTSSQPVSRSTSNSSKGSVVIESHMPFPRWFQEIGWRHVVGVITLAFAAFPVLCVISASLNPLGTVASTGLIPTKMSLVNYQNLLLGARDPLLCQYFNTIIIYTAVTTTQVFLSLLGAYAFSRSHFIRRRGGLLALLLIMMFPAILPMIAIYTMISDIGQVVPFLGLNTLTGYSLALTGGALGQVWLIRGTFDMIPRELDETAIIDDCTHWQVFRIIPLPAFKSIITTTLLLAFMGVISEFLLGPIILTDNSQKMLAVGLYGMLVGDRSNNLGIFAVGAVLTMAPVIALFQYLQRYIVGGSVSGAVKG